jgi:hypothetical protein
MEAIRPLKESGVKGRKSNELIIIPTKKLLNWYKYEKEV